MQHLIWWLDRLAADFDPAGQESIPQDILQAIDLADDLEPDCDLEDAHDAEAQGDDEPWLGWCVNGERGDWQDLEIDRQPALDHGAIALTDSAEDDDDRDPPVSLYVWGFTPKGEPGKCFQPPRPPNPGGHREVGASHRLGAPVQVGVGIHKIGTPAHDGKGGGHG